MRYTSRIYLKNAIYITEIERLFSAWPRLSGYDNGVDFRRSRRLLARRPSVLEF